jgi:hypothetical protein
LPEDGSGRFLRNVNDLPDYTLSYPRKPPSSWFVEVGTSNLLDSQTVLDKFMPNKSALEKLRLGSRSGGNSVEPETFRGLNLEIHNDARVGAFIITLSVDAVYTRM